jgi:hypothetical protein
VSIKNVGDVTAEDLRLTFRHSPNQAFPGSVNEAFWERIKSSAMLEPSHTLTLKSKYGLHPGEPHDVIHIPLDSIGTSPFPFAMSMEYWVKNQQSGRQSLTIEKPPTEKETTFQFGPFETKTKNSVDDRFVVTEVPYPTDGPLRGILDQIAGLPIRDEFGFIDLGTDPVERNVAIYRPHLSRVGETKRMSREALTRALKELVSLGWLEPLEPIGTTRQYALSDAAKFSSSFTKMVDFYVSQRERPR